MRIDDGWQTLITFAEKPNALFWEKTVTPPGIDGGGANDTTTMRNASWRTNAPKKLKTLSEGQAVCAYDPAVLEDALDMIQVNQLITITFPDGSTYAFWGWLDKFVPGELQEGSQPTATVTIIPSNQDNAGAETAPVYTPPA